MLYSTEEFLAVRQELEQLVDFPIKELVKESGLTRPTVKSWYCQEGNILVSTKTKLWIAITNLVERRREVFARLRSILDMQEYDNAENSVVDDKKYSFQNDDLQHD